LFSLQEDQDNTRISRQADEDCLAYHLADDEYNPAVKYPCILQLGHTGLHIDYTGFEFK